jgi:MFS family permease
MPGYARLAVVVGLPFAAGYFLSYLYRSVNAVIAADLVRDIGLGAAELGLLTAAYFVSFAAMQLPLGLLLDRFGPRRVQGCMLLSACAGAVLFAYGDTLTLLLLGRVLIGAGVAGALMGSFKAIALWFPKERWALANGCLLAAGGLGALTATVPVQAMLDVTDWRGVFFVLAGITLAVSGAILLVVPERDDGPAPRESLAEAGAAVAGIYRSGLFWRLAPLTMATMATGMALQGLWVAPWLRDIHGLDRDAVATGLLALNGLMTLGFVGTGAISDVLQRRGIGLLGILGVGTAIFIFSQLPLLLNGGGGVLGMCVVVAGIGLFSNVAVLSYPYLAAQYPAHQSARANTALNLVMMLSAFSVQWAMGGIIGLWPEGPDGTYDLAGYRSAFAVALILQLAAWAWFMFRYNERKARISA